MVANNLRSSIIHLTVMALNYPFLWFAYDVRYYNFDSVLLAAFSTVYVAGGFLLLRSDGRFLFLSVLAPTMFVLPSVLLTHVLRPLYIVPYIDSWGAESTPATDFAFFVDGISFWFNPLATLVENPFYYNGQYFAEFYWFDITSAIFSAIIPSLALFSGLLLKKWRNQKNGEPS